MSTSCFGVQRFDCNRLAYKDRRYVALQLEGCMSDSKLSLVAIYSCCRW